MVKGKETRLPRSPARSPKRVSATHGNRMRENMQGPAATGHNNRPAVAEDDRCECPLCRVRRAGIQDARYVLLRSLVFRWHAIPPRRRNGLTFIDAAGELLRRGGHEPIGPADLETVSEAVIELQAGGGDCNKFHSTLKVAF